MTPFEEELRSMLSLSSTPMPVSLLSKRTGRLQGTVSNALERMPDAYIVEWKPNDHGRNVARWTVVRVPPNAPRPPKKVKP